MTGARDVSRTDVILTAPSTTAGTVVEGGWVIDAETGEVVGHYEVDHRFHVKDLEAAEWVLERLQEVDSEVAALQTRLEAIEEQMGAMIREKRRRRQWLERRFGGELEAFARRTLEGQRTRTLKTPFGSLSFRRTPARVAVRDGLSLKDVQGGELVSPVIMWAEAHCPEAVVTRREFQVSKVPPGTPLPKTYFEEVPERDTFRIDTGVKVRD